MIYNRLRMPQTQDYEYFLLRWSARVINNAVLQHWRNPANPAYVCLDI